MIRLNPRIAKAVMQRDNGICSTCGIDTVAINAIMERLADQADEEARSIACQFERFGFIRKRFEQLVMQEVGRVPFWSRRTKTTYAFHVDPKELFIDIYNEPPGNIITLCDWCYWPAHHERSDRLFREARERSKRIYLGVDGKGRRVEQAVMF